MSEEIKVCRKNGKLRVQIGHFKLVTREDTKLLHIADDCPSFPDILYTWHISRELTGTADEMGSGIFSPTNDPTIRFEVAGGQTLHLPIKSIDYKKDSCESIARELAYRISEVRKWVKKNKIECSVVNLD